MNKDLVTVNAVVKKIIFQANDNYGIFIFTNLDTGDDFTGTCYQQIANNHFLEQELTIFGNWHNHPKFGQQFKIEYYQEKKPETDKAMINYLVACKLPGIAQKNAKKIVTQFGNKTFDILDNNIEKIGKIKGLNQSKISEIKDAWQEIKEERQTQLFLHQLNIGRSIIAKIYTRYGEKTASIISQTPYRLCQEINGIGFIKADTIAINLGLEKTSFERIAAGLSYSLQQATNDEGCTCLPKENLLNISTTLLQVDNNLVKQTLQMLIIDKRLVSQSNNNTDYIYSPLLFEQENQFATHITNFILKNQQPQKNNIKNSAETQLNEQQLSAVSNSINYPFSIITGGPGVGKTTTVKEIVYQAQQLNWDIALCAPTGRAAKRLEEITGIKAKTIHRLLGWIPEKSSFAHHHMNTLPHNIIIIDETSMIDLNLSLSICDAINDDTHLIFVGDIDQLPSIGAGAILHNLISLNKIPLTRLTTIFRQKKNSQIIDLTYKINQGQYSPIEKKPKDKIQQLYWINKQNPADIASMIKELLLKHIPKKFNIPIENCQILCPMKKFETGTENLNKMIQEAIIPPETPFIKNTSGVLYIGDRVMQIVNNYDKNIYNGDIGIIQSINLQNQKITVLFNSSLIEYNLEDKNQLLLSYAITVHKSQGSEFNAVIIPITSQHKLMLYRKLLYTAVSRAKQLLILIGNEQMLQYAIHNNTDFQPHSLLKETIINNLDMMK